MTITATRKFHFPLASGYTWGCYDLTGDLAGTATWTAPVGTVDVAWVQRLTDVETDEKLSVSGNVITFSTAIAEASTAAVHFIGSA